jgi:hypothetical protein
VFFDFASGLCVVMNVLYLSNCSFILLQVSVCVGNSDGWLCVAKLPLDYSEDEFHNLASAYGKVREAFIMISERTGKQAT